MVADAGEGDADYFVNLPVGREERTANMAGGGKDDHPVDPAPGLGPPSLSATRGCGRNTFRQKVREKKRLYHAFLSNNI